MVNALWQLDEESNRERFLKSFQTRWKELYSVDEAARMNLLAKAAKRQDGQRLSTPFVLVMSTAPTVSRPIAMFCQDIGVDAKSFFSPKVKG